MVNYGQTFKTSNRRKILLKKAHYVNPNLAHKDDPKQLEILYVIVGKSCYFSGTSQDCYTVSLAETIIETIARQERVRPEALRYFDFQTHLSGDRRHPGEYHVEELSLERLKGGRLHVSGWGAAQEPCPPQVIEAFKEQIGTEAPGELGQLYREEFMTRGFPIEVDQAIVATADALMARPFKREEFLSQWQNFLAAITIHTNISAANLAYMLLRMGNPEVQQEAFLAELLMVQLNPDSWEAWRYLGSRYRDLGNLAEARDAYLRAADISRKLSKEKKEGCRFDPILDATYDLRCAAEVERDMEQTPQAFIHALEAVRILRSKDHSHGLSETLELLGELAAKLGMAALENQCRQQAEEAKEKDRQLQRT